MMKKTLATLAIAGMGVSAAAVAQDLPPGAEAGTAAPTYSTAQIIGGATLAAVAVGIVADSSGGSGTSGTTGTTGTTGTF
ncbi:hypothetical protein [Halotalea alkalilenta]|uniref:hypothetical protein n=1 Tax=Halotalea alkalilenta TaxID=376489 RepID=UPI0005BC621F|nr:hypothetical protein [Halotalea alkalilenta]